MSDTPEDFCPARKVVEEAMTRGPATGWRDGWLTFERGILEPAHGSSRVALWRSAGRVWAMLAEQLPSLLESVTARLRVHQMPVVSADESSLDQDALIAAEVALSSLAHGYKWEWEKANPDSDWKISNLPPSVFEPWSTVCERLGMPGVGLTVNAHYNGRYRINDDALWSEDEPYAERIDNIRFEPALFGSREERVFLGCFLETSAIFSAGIKAFVDAQQAVKNDDPIALRAALREVKTLCDRMVFAFNKISTSEASGDINYCDPIIWGNTLAPIHSPINPDEDSPGGSGLYHPAFHFLDVFFSRSRYDSSLGVEAFHLRHWFPKNWCLLIDALDDPEYSVLDYVGKVETRRTAGEDLPPLCRAYDQARLAYVGERGWLGTHRYKVLGFLQIVSKAGRTNTNGGTASGQKPWEAVHNELQMSRAERMPPGEAGIKRDGAGICPFAASVVARNQIDGDASKRTQQVVIKVPEGLWWKPGDRLMTIVPNSAEEVAKTIMSLRRKPEDKIILDQKWTRWFEHAGKTLGLTGQKGQCVRVLPLEMLVKFSTLRPLGYREVQALQNGLSDLARENCRLNKFLKRTPHWPVCATLANLIDDAVPASTEAKFSATKICTMLSPQAIRTYSISNSPPNEEWEQTEATVELTVARQDFTCIANALESEKIGVCSGFLAPPPGLPSGSKAGSDQIMVGLQSPLNFALPHGDQPIVMFAAGSGIGPFRSFWQHRERHPRSETWLLFGCRDEQTLLYRDEIDALLKRGQCDFRPYISFSRVENKRAEFGPDGLKIVDGPSRGKYVADMMEKDERLASAIVDLALPAKLGGRGALFFVCGSVPFYEGLMQSLRKILALHNIDPSELLRAMSSERRFKIEVFGSPSGSSNRLVDGEVKKTCSFQPPAVWQSDLASFGGHYNDDGLRFAINGNVYDVTEFANNHPGGKRIIKDVCGTDATDSFILAAHDVNNEVFGMMESLFVGQLRQIDGERIKNSAVALSEAGRSLPQLMDVARTMLYDCVELQNVFENELDSTLAADQTVINQIRRLEVTVGRFLQELSGGESGSLGYRAAQEVSRLACQVLDSVIPKGEVLPWETKHYLELSEYLSLLRDVLFQVDGLDSVAARLSLQAKLDLDGIAARLTAIGQEGLKMLESVKHVMIAAIKDLEIVFQAVLEDEDIVRPELLERCIQLPWSLNNVIASRNEAAALAMSVKGEDVTKASTLMELRALDVPQYPEEGALNAMSTERALPSRARSRYGILSRAVSGLHQPLQLQSSRRRSSVKKAPGNDVTSTFRNGEQTPGVLLPTQIAEV